MIKKLKAEAEELFEKMNKEVLFTCSDARADCYSMIKAFLNSQIQKAYEAGQDRQERKDTLIVGELVKEGWTLERYLDSQLTKLKIEGKLE